MKSPKAFGKLLSHEISLCSEIECSVHSKIAYLFKNLDHSKSCSTRCLTARTATIISSFCPLLEGLERATKFFRENLVNLGFEYRHFRGINTFGSVYSMEIMRSITRSGYVWHNRRWECKHDCSKTDLILHSSLLIKGWSEKRPQFSHDVNRSTD